MAEKGQIEPFDFALVADTGGEPNRVYRFLNWLGGVPYDEVTIDLPTGRTIRKLVPRPGIWQDGVLSIPIHLVRAGDLEVDTHQAIASGANRSSNPPVYIRKTDGSAGRLNRKCTEDYKIYVKESYLRKMIGPDVIAEHLKPWRKDCKKIRRAARKEATPLAQLQIDGTAEFVDVPVSLRLPDPPAPLVYQAYGISNEEITRLRQSDQPWIENLYPLVFEARDGAGMTRSECGTWLKRNGYPVPEFSACVFCPFNGAKRFRSIAKDSDDWNRAIAYDEAIRNGLPGSNQEAYLLRNLKPLASLELTEVSETTLFDSFEEECSGHCGV